MPKKNNFKNKAIFYKDDGKGNPLVLIHGFLESMLMWDDFARELSKEFRVIRIDLPGYGQSELVEEVHTMKLFADSVKAVLDHLSVKNCVMVGHSMGGYVTLEFVKNYPEMVKGFGLFHSHASADTMEAKENRRRTINIIKLNRTGFIKQFIPDLFAEDNVVKYSNEIDLLINDSLKISSGSIIASLEGMKQRDGKIDLLLKTKKPVLFIAGKEDTRIPVQKIMAQAILPHHSEILIMGNVGHMGYIEAKTDTIEMIKCFVRKNNTISHHL